MAKNKKDSFNSYGELFMGSNEKDHDEVVKKEEDKNEYEVKNRSEERKKIEKEDVRKISNKKKPGRPKSENRELRKRYTFTLLPNIYDKAQIKCMEEGTTVSEVVNKLLSEYIK